MNNDDVERRLDSHPPRGPKRHLTASDISLMAAVALLLYFGAFAAGVGHASGLLFAALASLGAISVRASRFGRLNEPKLEKFTFPLSVGVSVFIFIYALGMLRGQTYQVGESLGLSVIPLAIYAIYLAILLRPRGAQ